jgi:hypothetical protein
MVGELKPKGPNVHNEQVAVVAEKTSGSTKTWNLPPSLTEVRNNTVSVCLWRRTADALR